MKSKTKKLVALSLTATLCGALATFATLTSPTEVSASTTPTFKMADGAGIRYTSEDGKKEGLRFIVLADETTKNAIVNSGTIGFVATAAENFVGVESDYETEMSDYAHEFTVTADNFYQNEEEYGDLYCANVVINMGTNDTVENFTERQYSAVAYYATGADTYAYTENRQERSIQEVASKLYMQGDADWAKVSDTYTALGTETTPFLVAESGDNSYEKLVENVTADINFGADYTFELAGDVAIDSKILDGESASDITNSTEFDTAKKYDSQSNGSYKISVDVSGTTDAVGTVDYKINPVKTQADYKAMQLVGYDHIAIRFMAENYTGNGTVGLRYINTTTSDMYIYQDNQAITSLESGSTIWQNHLSNASNGKWGEMVFGIDKFVNATQDGMTLLQAYANKGESNNLTMDLYIDNVYAVKGFIGETKETIYQDKNSTYTNEDMICTATVDGKDVSVENNTVTLDTYGVYSIKETTRDTYGYVAQTVIPNGTVVSNIVETYSAQHKTTAGTYTDFIGSENNGKITLSSNQASTTTSTCATTYSINPVGDASYYAALKVAGYKYITYTYTFDYEGAFVGTSSSTGNAISVDVYRNALTTGAYRYYRDDITYAPFTTDGTTPDRSGMSTSKIYGYTYQYKEENATQASNTKDKTSNYHLVNLGSSFDSGKTYYISIEIDDFIHAFNADKMNILTLALTYKTDANVSYSVTFGKIAATTSACVFD